MAQREAWEGELRRTLADEAARVRPSPADLAGPAIAHARRVQRRRNLAGLAAIAGATVLAAGLLLQGWQGAGRTELGATGMFEEPATVTASPSSPAPRLASDQTVAAEAAVDVIGEGARGGVVLVTGGGQALDLGRISGVVSAHRAGEGWAVVSGEPGSAKLWWVTADREPVALLAGMDSIVVDGTQVAWRRGVVLFAAALTGAGDLEGRTITAAPDGDGQPVGFAGETVLLRRSDPEGWDTWRPSLGDYHPEWTSDVARVYGGLPGGSTAVGLVPDAASGGLCLAVLDIEISLAAGPRTCVAEQLSVDGPAAVSPQGRWLVATGVAAAPGGGSGGSGAMRTVLVDLAALAGAGPAGAAEAVTVVDGVGPMAGRPVWSGPDQVLFPTPDSLVRLWPERLVAGAGGAVELIPLTGVPPLLVEPV